MLKISQALGLQTDLLSLELLHPVKAAALVIEGFMHQLKLILGEDIPLRRSLVRAGNVAR